MKTDWLNDDPKERFAGQFEKWTFGFLDIPELIVQTEKVFEYPMCGRDPAGRWSFGSLTLLGELTATAPSHVRVVVAVVP